MTPTNNALALAVVCAGLSWTGVVHAQWITHFNHDFEDAISKDDTVQVTVFLDTQKDVNAPQKNGTTFLQAAAYWGKTNAVQLLLDRGAKPDLADKHGRTALHYAVIFNACEMGTRIPLGLQWGKKNACQLLLQNGGKATVRDEDGNLPLHWAVHPHCCDPPVVARDVCELLLAKGGEINATNGIGLTPLHLAVEYGGPTNLCEFLLAKGVDINATNGHGRTPLHFVADYHVPMNLCEFLLAKGASVAVTNDQGETALTAAERAGNDDMAELLRRHMMKKQQEKTPGSALEPNTASPGTALPRRP